MSLLKNILLVFVVLFAYQTTECFGQSHFSSLLNGRTVTKVLFVVDKSGTNRNSDPDAEIRTAFIRNFYEQHQYNGWYSWGMITFSGDRAESQIYNSSDSRYPTFSRHHQRIERAIDSLRFPDSDNIRNRANYRPALQLVKTAIREDDTDQFQEEEGATFHYVVIFITQARPKDAQYSRNKGIESYLYEDVEAIVNLGQGRHIVTLSTVYYGIEHQAQHSYLDSHGLRTPNPNIPQATNILRTMADHGGGEYTQIDNPRSLPSTLSFPSIHHVESLEWY